MSWVLNLYIVLVLICWWKNLNESNNELIEQNPFPENVRLIPCSTNTTGRPLIINNGVVYSFSKRNESNKYLIEHNPFLVFVRLITCSTNTTGRKILLGLCTSSHYFLLLQRTKKPTVWQDWTSRTRNKSNIIPCLIKFE